MPNIDTNLLLIIVPFVVILGWDVYLHLKINKINKRLSVFFQGKKAVDLEEVLFTEIKRLKQTEQSIKALIENHKALQEMSAKSIQKVGIVRFNPFKNTGGDQSFAIALLDYHSNGLVISSLYTREGTHIYSKPIIDGKSKYQLSKEEIQALEKAGV